MEFQTSNTRCTRLITSIFYHKGHHVHLWTTAGKLYPDTSRDYYMTTPLIIPKEVTIRFERNQHTGSMRRWSFIIDLKMHLPSQKNLPRAFVIWTYYWVWTHRYFSILNSGWSLISYPLQSSTSEPPASSVFSASPFSFPFTKFCYITSPARCPHVHHALMPKKELGQTEEQTKHKNYRQEIQG